MFYGDRWLWNCLILIQAIPTPGKTIESTHGSVQCEMSCVSSQMALVNHPWVLTIAGQRPRLTVIIGKWAQWGGLTALIRAVPEPFVVRARLGGLWAHSHRLTLTWQPAACWQCRRWGMIHMTTYRLLAMTEIGHDTHDKPAMCW